MLDKLQRKFERLLTFKTDATYKGLSLLNDAYTLYDISFVTKLINGHV